MTIKNLAIFVSGGIVMMMGLNLVSDMCASKLKNATDSNLNNASKYEQIIYNTYE